MRQGATEFEAITKRVRSANLINPRRPRVRKTTLLASSMVAKGSPCGSGQTEKACPNSPEFAILDRAAEASSHGVTARRVLTSDGIQPPSYIAKGRA